jgi:hypothetical protein
MITNNEKCVLYQPFIIQHIFVEHHIYNVPIEPSKEETFEHSESFFDDVLL